MTKERRDTINRRLAEFNKWIPLYEGQEPWNYCGDLNALARLEGKLPPHTWQVDYGRLQPRIEVELRVELENSDVWSMADSISESEARAEAIYKYLTRETACRPSTG